MRLDSDVGKPDELTGLAALVGDLLVRDDDEISYRAQLVVAEFPHLHAEHRKSGVCAHHGGEIEPGYLRIEQVLWRRVLGSIEQLVEVDDLQHAAAVGAIAEVDAVALRTRGDHAVERGRHLTGGARLLSRQPEGPNE